MCGMIHLCLPILKPLKTLWTIISLFIVSQMTNWPPYVPLSAKANVVYYMSDVSKLLSEITDVQHSLRTV